MELNNDIYNDILGICLTDSSKLPYITTKINIDAMPVGVHREIYKSILDLYKLGVDVDIVTVSNRLLNTNKLKDIGGRATINELALNSPQSRYTKKLVEEVIKQNTYRNIISLVEEFKEDVNNSTDISTTCINYCSRISNVITGNLTEDKLETISSGVGEVIEDLYKSKDNGCVGIDCGFPSLNYFLGGLQKGKLYILGARPSMGKGLGLDCNILTNNGWVKNKDIKLGDKVIGRDGKETTVIGIYPQPLQRCYKIMFKDGREIVCDAPHEWTVYYSKWGKERTFTTEELYHKLKHNRYHNRISLPRFNGDYGIEKDFIIHPYIMGVLIGDGCLTKSMCYCKPSYTIYSKVMQYAPTNVTVKLNDKTSIVSLLNWKQGWNYIKQIGLNTQSYNKFIPKEYFNSSKEQRELLFQGLIDTDGYNTGKGYEYSTTSKQLAEDVQQLAWSLGYNCKIKSRLGKYWKDGVVKETRINYRLYITSCKPLTITSIEEVEPIPTQCIHVDNSDSLFVIEDYLVTHNSALAMNLSEYVAKNNNVLFVSLEMGKKEYAQRLMFGRAGVDISCVNTGRITDAQIELIKEQKEYLDSLNLYIETKSPCKVSDIELAIINLQATKGSCDLVVVDYLQLLTPSSKSSKNREVEVAEMSRELKSLSVKYNVPIIVLSQLSRALESREDKRPMLSDLRESGSIEQDADIVMFVYRDEYYHPDDATTRGEAELLIRKNRGGINNRDVKLCFQASKVRFTEQIG